jgi:hypothetical protein
MIIHHHLGLGDHIICNGLVRKLIEQVPRDIFGDSIPKDLVNVLVVKHSNLSNVTRMFRDVKLAFAPVSENNQESYSRGNIGWAFGGSKNLNFDESFYDQVNINFSHRWDSFHIERDYKQEKTISDYLNLPPRFALVNDVASAGKADVDIQTELPRVDLRKLPVEKSMFDWMEVIERATEVHCINSSFVHLVDSMNPMAKLFFYNDRPKLPFTRRLEWEICQ